MVDAIINKTKAKSQFGLSDDDLSYVVAKPNPHGGRPAYVYELDEIKILAKAVHGDLDAYFGKKEEKLAIKQQYEQEREARKADLLATLHILGLHDISSDDLEHQWSDMCGPYMDNGLGDMNESDVLDLMHQIRFYNRHTRHT